MAEGDGGSLWMWMCPLAGLAVRTQPGCSSLWEYHGKSVWGREHLQQGSFLPYPIQPRKMKLFSRADRPLTGKKKKKRSINLGKCCSLAYGFINRVMDPGREIAFCEVSVSRFVADEPPDLTGSEAACCTEQSLESHHHRAALGSKLELNQNVHLVALKVTRFCAV